VLLVRHLKFIIGGASTRYVYQKRKRMAPQSCTMRTKRLIIGIVIVWYQCRVRQTDRRKTNARTGRPDRDKAAGPRLPYVYYSTCARISVVYVAHNMLSLSDSVLFPPITFDVYLIHYVCSARGDQYGRSRGDG
jgi:hypothetical protein